MLEVLLQHKPSSGRHAIGVYFTLVRLVACLVVSAVRLSHHLIQTEQTVMSLLSPERTTDGRTYVRTINNKGERRNFKFSDLKRKMVEIFDQSDNLKQHEGYSGIDQRSRVRYLQNAIKTGALSAVQSQIDTSPALQVNFKDACQAFQDFVNRQKPIDIRNVSRVQAEVESATPQREGYLAWEQCKHAQVQDRYYSEKEYKKLTPLQKAKLHHMRSKRGGGGDTAGGGRRRGNPRKGNGGNKTLKREIKQMVASMMKDARIPVPDAEGTSGSDDDVTNRNNPALKRQKLNKSGGKKSDE